MAKQSLLGSLFGRTNDPAERGRALLVAGTASHVGKSWTATAICRSLTRRGLRVAPFKAQNLSNNAYVCADGAEIGRSQAAQAEACGIEPTAEMNPILLKPSGEGVQAVVEGKTWRTFSNGDLGRHLPQLWDVVEGSYRRLAAEYDFVVMEGAGAAVELNLRGRDLANLPLAERLETPVLLVADIERGGVFGAVVGTLELLGPSERELVTAVAVNRFRGDPKFFADGRELLAERAEVPCLGVYPFDDSIRLDEEDAAALDARPRPARRPEELRTAIIRLPHIANFTDFRLLPNAEYITEATAYVPDLLIIPGTKNTLADLAWLKKEGLDRWILDMRKEGTAIWGVCGGYQMLGRFVEDPLAVESRLRRLSGLGVLPHQTTLAEEKVTRRVRPVLESGGLEFDAYEIHVGRGGPVSDDTPFCRINGRPEGAYRRGILGTYMHGAFEDEAVMARLLADVAAWRSKKAPAIDGFDKDAEYDKLADWFERWTDMPLFEELYLP